MGCDIHLCTEVRKDGQWINVDKWEADEYEDGTSWFFSPGSFYDRRNYAVFAILADVRNNDKKWYDAGEPLNVIAQPRGIPGDASPETKRLVEQWESDGHSHSWLTLKELMDFDWTQIATNRALVNAVHFDVWDQYGRKYGEAPAEAAAWVSGASVEHVTEEEMRRRLEKITSETQGVADGWRVRRERIETELRSVYAKCEWQQPYHKMCREFLADCLPRLWRLGPQDDVRIVFFFDN